MIDDSIYFEMISLNRALKISVVTKGPSKDLPRFDDLLKNTRSMLGTHWRQQFEFAKWRPKKLDQSIWFEISASDPFGFKHCG